MPIWALNLKVPPYEKSSFIGPKLVCQLGQGGRQALAELACEEKQLAVVPGATHLFEEPGALDEVARLAAEWFTNHLHD